MKTKVKVLLLIAVLLAAHQSLQAQSGSDGKIYDLGAEMTEPAANAPEELSGLQYILGDWQVKVSVPGQDGMTTHTGISSITFFNHGHGYMEHYDSVPSDDAGVAHSSAFLLVYNHGKETWQFGEADTARLAIRTLSGTMNDSSLVLYDAYRFMEGADLVVMRMTFAKAGTGFERLVEISPYGKNQWSVVEKRVYSPLGDDVIPEENQGFGSPAITNFDAAREFDFLIGEVNLKHWYFNGKDKPGIEIVAPVSAVYILNGHAIMEHYWFAEEQEASEREITIIRIYNPATRRWECIYVSNQDNSILYFGGAKKGDEIVLNNFGSNAMAPVNYFKFYDIEGGKYRWRGTTSRDGGKTWQDFWRIEVLEERK